jgi:hypothetical protein
VRARRASYRAVRDVSRPPSLPVVGTWQAALAVGDARRARIDAARIWRAGHDAPWWHGAPRASLTGSDGGVHWGRPGSLRGAEGRAPTLLCESQDRRNEKETCGAALTAGADTIET